MSQNSGLEIPAQPYFCHTGICDGLLQHERLLSAVQPCGRWDWAGPDHSALHRHSDRVFPVFNRLLLIEIRMYRKYLRVAMTLIASGGSLGNIVMPLLFHAGIEKLGWKGSMFRSF